MPRYEANLQKHTSIYNKPYNDDVPIHLRGAFREQAKDTFMPSMAGQHLNQSMHHSQAFDIACQTTLKNQVEEYYQQTNLADIIFQGQQTEEVEEDESKYFWNQDITMESVYSSTPTVESESENEVVDEPYTYVPDWQSVHLPQYIMSNRKSSNSHRFTDTLYR